MKIIVQALYLAGEFADRLQQTIIDVSLRDLLRGVTKKTFGAGYRHVLTRELSRPATRNGP